MNIRLTAIIEEFNGAGYLGWIEGLKGLVVQGNSEDEVRTELITSLKVKIAFDLGFDMDSMSSEKLSDDQDLLTIGPVDSKRKTESFSLTLQPA